MAGDIRGLLGFPNVGLRQFASGYGPIELLLAEVRNFALSAEKRSMTLFAEPRRFALQADHRGWALYAQPQSLALIAEDR